MKRKIISVYLFFVIILFITSQDYSQTSAYISVDISSTYGDSISPLIYGGFIEVLWDGIDIKYGLWAQEIKFRGLENWTLVTKHPVDTLPYFKVQSNCNLVWTIDTSRVNLKDNCSRKIQISNFNSSFASIGQHGINLNPGETYDVYAYLKGNGKLKGITIRLLVNVKDRMVIDSIIFTGIDNS